MRGAVILLAALALAACSTAPRSPVAEQSFATHAPYGIPGAIRSWGDSIGAQNAALILQEEVARARVVHGAAIEAGETPLEHVLALSGGGADGAFGAGFLAGWTERGDRPVFDVVTGVSTGAIIGLFAFLGPDYDPTLKNFYTLYSTDDLFEPAPFAALSGGSAISDSTGYDLLVDAFIDDALVARLGAEGQAGRKLLIGTTNLDAARPVIWDVTLIAESGHPDAKQLIRDIIRASSAIPALMPPVVIPAVSPEGTRFDEVHVDGGATQQVMLFSPELPIAEVDKAIGTAVDRELYVIINNSLQKPYQPVELGVLSIAGKAVSSLISGSGTGDLYKLFAIAERDNVGFNVISIPPSFTREPAEAFDPPYMRELYDLGRTLGLSEAPWQNHPPNFVPG
ncbi:MAG: patatin-like phospholipase family protein [Pseudomonadota bacterium]